MRQINPYMAAAHRNGEPDENAAKRDNFLTEQRAATTDIRKYRLYSRDVPVGMVVECTPMEAEGWNKNARAYYAWQCSLGRERMPLLIYQEEKKADAPCWRVDYTVNGKPYFERVVASSLSAAQAEFRKVAPVTAFRPKFTQIDSEVHRTHPDSEESNS